MKKNISNFDYSKKDLLSPFPLTRINTQVSECSPECNNYIDCVNKVLFNYLKINYLVEDLDELNSLFYRSDNFKKEHVGTHVLFCGDSYTFGNGLLKDEVWSKKLYKKLSEEINLSGYFNLSQPGISIPSLIFDVFRYSKIYGNPNIIFLNIPDPHRMFCIKDTDDGEQKNTLLSDSLIEMISYQYYYMLEQYCLTNGIKLYTFSWSFNNSLSKINTLSRYYNFSFNDFLNWQIEKKTQKNEFSGIARDGSHPGTIAHDFYVDFIYDKYKKDLADYRRV